MPLRLSNKGRCACSVGAVDSILSPGYSKDVIDSTLNHQKRNKPGYSSVINSMMSQQKGESRLQQMSVHQRDRLATELTEEREARLRQMSIRQCERLEEERIRQTGEREKEPSSQLVNQSSIQVKMRTFHGHFATLTSPRRSTCSESFPRLQLHPPSNNTYQLRLAPNQTLLVIGKDR